MKKSTARMLARFARPVSIAHAETFFGTDLFVYIVSTGNVVTLKATVDGRVVRTLSFAFDGRRGVSNDQIDSVAAQLVNTLENYNSDTVRYFADSFTSGWEYDYSARAGELLDRLADGKALPKKQRVA